MTRRISKPRQEPVATITVIASIAGDRATFAFARTGYAIVEGRTTPLTPAGILAVLCRREDYEGKNYDKSLEHRYSFQGTSTGGAGPRLLQFGVSELMSLFLVPALS